MPDEHARPLGPMMEEAAKSLQEGTWKKTIMDACNVLAAGEETAKSILLYSGLSSNLPNRLHVFLFGKSQRGKSFLQGQVGTFLFGDRLHDATSFSSKVNYYKAGAEENPRILHKKILLVDEFNDRDEETQAFLKALTTTSRDEMEHETLIKQKPIKLVLKGLPVVWTNTMELTKDVGNQIHNRYFKLNVNETLEHSRNVEQFQIMEETFGRNVDDEKIELSRTIIAMILEAGDFITLNPFAGFIKQSNYEVLNRRPKYHALLSAITYANWRTRVTITDGGLLVNPRLEDLYDTLGRPARKKILLASLGDNLEALRLWTENERFERYSLPERYLKFLGIFTPGDWLNKEEMSDRFKMNQGADLSSESCYQYAKTLCEKDVLTGRQRKGEHYWEWGLLDMSKKSLTRPLLEFDGFNSEILADAVKGILERTLTSLTQPEREEPVEGVVKALLDTELPKISPKTNLDSYEREEYDT